MGTGRSVDTLPASAGRRASTELGDRCQPEASWELPSARSGRSGGKTRSLPPKHRSAWFRRSAKGGREVAYVCLDRSELRDHLAGKLASELLRHFVNMGWLRKTPGDRALDVTPPGQVALQARLPPPQPAGP